MSNPVYATFTLPTTAANNIAQSQTPGGAGAITLNGTSVTSGVALVSALSAAATARRVAVTSASADESGKTFTITGTDRGGNAVSEVLTGPGAGATVISLFDYKTVSSIVVSAATTGAITSGFSATGSTKWYPLDTFRSSFVLGIGMHLTTGSSTASVEYTLEPYDKTMYELDPTIAVGSFVAPLAIVPTAFSGKSANTDGAITQPVRAIRLTITAGTGTWAFSVIQTGTTP